MASISNNEIKRVKSLQQKKFRDELGLFTVEGEKMVEEALNSVMEVENVYRTSDIGHDAMSRISALSSPSPVLAVVRKPADIYVGDLSLMEKTLSEGGLFLALDTIRDPGNLGTILRIADWFGIDAVFARCVNIKPAVAFKNKRVCLTDIFLFVDFKKLHNNYSSTT